MSDLAQGVPQKRKRALPLADNPDALSIPQFCAQHNISQWLYFELQKAGCGPRTMRVGGRVLISRESAARWRRARERDATHVGLKKERRASSS
jgi:hypothetical protein